MAEDVKVLQLRTHEYAAEVHEGNETTEHRAVLSGDLLDTLGVAEAEEERLVAETVKYLLQRVPVTAVPHDIYVDELRRSETDFVSEMRARMVT